MQRATQGRPDWPWTYLVCLTCSKTEHRPSFYSCERIHQTPQHGFYLPTDKHINTTSSTTQLTCTGVLKLLVNTTSSIIHTAYLYRCTETPHQSWEHHHQQQQQQQQHNNCLSGYKAEPVPEETLTHPPFWSSNLYQLLPSATIHSILLVQIACLAIFLHNLFPCPLWSTSWVWSPPPHISCTSNIKVLYLHAYIETWL